MFEVFATVPPQFVTIPKGVTAVGGLPGKRNMEMLHRGNTFTPNAGFEERARALSLRRGRSQRPVYVVDADGNLYRPHHASGRNRIPFQGLFMIALSVWLTKTAAIVYLGQTTYGEMVAPFADGSTVERAAFLLLEIDGASAWLAQKMLELRVFVAETALHLDLL